jgi:hypothetical protein
MEKVQWLSMVLSVLLFTAVVHFMRKRYLREQYSLLWLFFCVVIFVFSLSTRLLESTAALLGVKYAPALLFLFGIMVCLLLILHLTIVVSRLAERIIRLTQELGMATHRLDKYEQEKGL